MDQAVSSSEAVTSMNQELSPGATTTKTSHQHPQPPSLLPVVGVHGVRLKHFEQVLANILPHVQPDYVCIPPLPPAATVAADHHPSWPFDQLPPSARVGGTHPGQLAKPDRAKRKEQQLQSMLRCILPLIPSTKLQSSDIDDDEPFTIVDFGGGSGHLGIPLALLLPTCRIVVVDLRKRSLDLMHQKVELVVQEIGTDPVYASKYQSKSNATMNVPGNDSAFASCGRDGILENLFTFHGPVEQYTQSFDMALALHLCGEATDVTLRKAVSVQATAIVVAPCCVGKLSQQVRNPNIYHATGQNSATVSYPQSPTFCQVIGNQADWDALAKAADYSNEKETRTSLNAARRTAKALLETDRRLFLESHSIYRTALMRMDPWEATPKNDIIVAWDPNKLSVAKDMFSKADPECQADMKVVRLQLFHSKSTTTTTTTTTTTDCNSVAPSSNDWTADETLAIQEQITDFLKRTENLSDCMDQVYIFPTGMGGRKRKLIHFVARQYDLAHWSVGEKAGDKTVAVARRGQRRKGAKHESSLSSSTTMNDVKSNNSR